MIKLAKFFSYLLHPAFMPLIGLFIIFNSGIYSTNVPWEVEKYSYLIVALFSILLPFSILPVFFYWKLISNFEIKARRERILPLTITAFCLVFLHFFISRIIPIKIITSYTFAIASLAILLLLINMFYKISMHLMGIGGITGLIIALTVIYDIPSFSIFLLVILTSGIIASSRLALSAHSSGQLTIGYAVGLFTMYFVLSALI